MKKIIYFILLIMMTTLVSAETVIIPYQELPKSGMISFNISSPNYENYTIINTVSNEKISLNYPIEIYSDNELIIPLDVNYVISSFPIVANKTLNVSLSFNTTSNTISNFTKNIFFIIAVNETIVDAQTVESFQILNNTANIKLSFDILPYNSSQTFLFKGIVGTLANLTFCGEWLFCPSSFTFINQEEKVNISFNIPKNTPMGLYERIFSVQQGDKIKNVTIKFNITEPTIIIPDLSLDECYAKVELTAVEDCINAKIELQKETLAQIFALARARQQNFTQIQEIEKLVMVGSVDKELKSLYDSCSSDLNKSRELYNSCSVRRDELQTDREHFIGQLDQKQIEFDLQKEKLLNETAYNIQKERDSKKWWLISLLSITVLIFGFLLYKKRWEDYNHKKLWG